MRRQRVSHPPLRAAATLERGRHGHGGPSGPIPPTVPRAKPGPVQLPTVPNPLDGLASALSNAFKEATTTAIGGGQIVLGVVLIVAGLLLATGLAAKGARTGARVGRAVARIP